VEGEGRDREYLRGVALVVRAVLDLSYRDRPGEPITHSYSTLLPMAQCS
jgi:hypothetical protein